MRGCGRVGVCTPIRSLMPYGFQSAMCVQDECCRVRASHFRRARRPSSARALCDARTPSHALSLAPVPHAALCAPWGPSTPLCRPCHTRQPAPCSLQLSAPMAGSLHALPSLCEHMHSFLLRAALCTSSLLSHALVGVSLCLWTLHDVVVHFPPNFTSPSARKRCRPVAAQYTLASTSGLTP